MFEETRDARGGAVAMDLERVPCRACGEPLLERNLNDGESLMVLGADDPLVGELRAAQATSRRRGRRPWNALARFWRVQTDENPVLFPLALGLLLLAGAFLAWRLSR